MYPRAATGGTAQSFSERGGEAPLIVDLKDSVIGRREFDEKAGATQILARVIDWLIGTHNIEVGCEQCRQDRICIESRIETSEHVCSSSVDLQSKLSNTDGVDLEVPFDWLRRLAAGEESEKEC